MAVLFRRYRSLVYTDPLVSTSPWQPAANRTIILPRVVIITTLLIILSALLHMPNTLRALSAPGLSDVTGRITFCHVSYAFVFRAQPQHHQSLHVLPQGPLDDEALMLPASWGSTRSRLKVLRQAVDVVTWGGQFPALRHKVPGTIINGRRRRGGDKTRGRVIDQPATPNTETARKALSKRGTAVSEQARTTSRKITERRSGAGCPRPGELSAIVWTSLTTRGVRTRSKETAGGWLSLGRRCTKRDILSDSAMETACAWLASPREGSPKSTSYSVNPHSCPNYSAWLAKPRAISPHPSPSCFPWRRSWPLCS